MRIFFFFYISKLLDISISIWKLLFFIFKNSLIDIPLCKIVDTIIVTRFIFYHLEQPNQSKKTTTLRSWQWTKQMNILLGLIPYIGMCRFGKMIRESITAQLKKQQQPIKARFLGYVWMRLSVTSSNCKTVLICHPSLFFKNFSYSSQEFFFIMVYVWWICSICLVQL